ncbi:ABC transporter permease [Streptomyces oceani]|uniref:ABC transmembrane type-2 domain-containing protein n=1 Tax=Streptomyces oceani TaxID=1075402 RepID=A0A1E7JWI1_9ACTN|nr:ABC transporter permease [Streptomyces oceani]OEU95959.1 hypothetical protein AN216_22750 [Streptomyces oceani]
MTTIAGRMSALGRAEFTLLVRNRSAMFTALLVPPGLVLGARQMFDGMPMVREAGLSIGEMLMATGFGLVLTMAIYTTLVASYVTRREELVLKRLRTGEASDTQILASTALPVTVLGLAQVVLLLVAGVTLMDVGVPERPDLLLVGVLSGMLLTALLAAVTTIITRTVESAQITVMPVMMVTMVTSGMVTPLDALPGAVAEVCRFLPLTPAVQLVQGGLLGGMDALEVLRALGVTLAWTALAVFAVRRWFRWEPRR